MEDSRPRQTKVSPLLSLVAPAADGTLYQVTTGRTYRVRKVFLYNGQAADITLELRTLVALVSTVMFPRVRAIAGFHDLIGENDLPALELSTDLLARASAAGAGALAVDVMVEVEEIG